MGHHDKFNVALSDFRDYGGMMEAVTSTPTEIADGQPAIAWFVGDVDEYTELRGKAASAHECRQLTENALRAGGMKEDAIRSELADWRD